MPEMVTTVFTFITGEMTTLLTTISGNALLVFPVVVSMFSGVIGITFKILGKRRKR